MYRKPVLLPPVDMALKEMLTRLATEHGYEVLGVEVNLGETVLLAAPFEDGAALLYSRRPM